MRQTTYTHLPAVLGCFVPNVFPEASLGMNSDPREALDDVVGQVAGSAGLAPGKAPGMADQIWRRNPSI